MCHPAALTSVATHSVGADGGQQECSYWRQESCCGSPCVGTATAEQRWWVSKQGNDTLCDSHRQGREALAPGDVPRLPTKQG